MALLRKTSLLFAAASLGATALIVSPARAEPPAARVVEAPAEGAAPAEAAAQPSPKLGFTGGIMLGTSYVATAIVASLSLRNPNASYPELYIPIVGPWIAIPNAVAVAKRTPGDPAAHNTDFLPAVGLGFVGLAQGIGAWCLTAYLVEKRSAPASHAVSSVRVMPYVGVGGGGLIGSF